VPKVRNTFLCYRNFIDLAHINEDTATQLVDIRIRLHRNAVQCAEFEMWLRGHDEWREDYPYLTPGMRHEMPAPQEDARWLGLRSVANLTGYSGPMTRSTTRLRQSAASNNVEQNDFGRGRIRIPPLNPT
jgi:hypothetical protein